MRIKRKSEKSEKVDDEIKIFFYRYFH